LDEEFVRGTVAIDKEGVVTDTLFCADRKVEVKIVIPQGALGDFTSYDHERLWRAYQRVRGRVEAIVKEKHGGLPTQSCTLTLEKADLSTAH
jgi:hypothetical protein